MDDIEGRCEIKTKSLRQGQSLGVQLARDDRQVVIDKFCPRTGASGSAMMDRRAHRFEQRFHHFEVGWLGTNHKQALAAIGMPCEPADGSVDCLEPQTLGFGVHLVGGLGIDGRQIHHKRAGLGVGEQTIDAHHDLIDFAARW